MDWTTLISVLAPAITGLVGWLAGSRKRNLGYLDVLIQSQQDFVDRSVQMAEDYAKIKSENAILREENESLKKQVSRLQKQVDRLRTQLDAFLESTKRVEP